MAKKKRNKTQRQDYRTDAREADILGVPWELSSRVPNYLFSVGTGLANEMLIFDDSSSTIKKKICSGLIPFHHDWIYVEESSTLF